MAKNITGEGVESLDERLAALFRAERPRRIDPFRKRRILVKLERLQRRGAPRFSLRPVIAAALFVSGSAAAELGHHYASSEAALRRSESQLANLPTAAPAKPLAPMHLADCATSGRTATAEPVPHSEAAFELGPPPTNSRAHAGPEASEHPEQVALAIQVLRIEGNPLRAQILLDAYLKAHPHSVLAGDALALSIEAASARRDPRAADYARRYLASFPHGPYRDLAARASALPR